LCLKKTDIFLGFPNSSIDKPMSLTNECKLTKEVYEAWIKDVMREVAKLSNQEFR
jgi:hypothetical protein